MNDCYFEKKDWRACATEVSCLAEENVVLRLIVGRTDASISGMLETEGQRRQDGDERCLAPACVGLCSEKT